MLPSLPSPSPSHSIAVCTLVGDPYPNEALFRPLLQHQLVYSVKDGHNLFIKCAIEKQHCTCVFSFNSMFSESPQAVPLPLPLPSHDSSPSPDVPELCLGIHLGFILVYSTQRLASLSVLKYLLPKLPSIPKLIVAMTTNKSHDKKCLEEGQQFASQWGAMLVSNSEDELRGKCTWILALARLMTPSLPSLPSLHSWLCYRVLAQVLVPEILFLESSELW